MSVVEVIVRIVGLVVASRLAIVVLPERNGGIGLIDHAVLVHVAPTHAQAGLAQFKLIVNPDPNRAASGVLSLQLHTNDDSDKFVPREIGIDQKVILVGNAVETRLPGECTTVATIHLEHGVVVG